MSSSSARKRPTERPSPPPGRVASSAILRVLLAASLYSSARPAAYCCASYCPRFTPIMKLSPGIPSAGRTDPLSPTASATARGHLKRTAT